MSPKSQTQRRSAEPRKTTVLRASCFYEEEWKMKKTTVKLSIIAGALMLLAGGVLAAMKAWLCAALLGAGGLGCLAGALNRNEHEQ